jgi:nucleotide-binding universal stress UspA family protein
MPEMLVIKHVLCAIDFSVVSRRAISVAATISRWYDADLTLLHVADAYDPTPPGLGPSPGWNLGTPDESRRARIMDELRRSISGTGADADADAAHAQLVVREGKRWTTILTEADRLHADLLVVGSHGRGGFDRLLLGSVSERVVRSAPCPVLTVPLRAAPMPTGAFLPKRILCPLDYSPSSMQALRYALALGQESGASLTVLHAIEWLADDQSRSSAQFDVSAYRQLLIEDARARLLSEIPDDVRTWCDVDAVVVFGKSHREILGAADRMDADLIVMGAQGRGAIDSLMFGSTSEQVLRAATCPVLTLRARAESGDAT